MTRFEPQHGLIIVRVTFFGPKGDRAARLALDTGATSTVVSKEILIAVGYEPASLPQTVQMTTGSGIASAARLEVDKIQALGQERLNFSIIAHTLPPSASVDGVLGLDYLRDSILTLNFQSGEIILE